MNRFRPVDAKNAAQRDESIIRPVHAQHEGTRLAAGGVEFHPTQCQAQKKDGTACQARPALGGSMCVGHLRSAGEVWQRGE